MQSTDVAQKKDRRFIIGLVILCLSWLGLTFTIYVGIFFMPFYLLGAALIWFSQKSRRTKLWIIIPPFFINTSMILIGLVLFRNLF